MKTSVDISASLHRRAVRAAKQTGRTFRDMIEDGLRRVLDEIDRKPPQFHLPDRAVGERGAHNPLAAMTWEELRDEIYRSR